MKDPEAIVWDAINDSAKTRFDYAEFASGMSEFDDGTMAENMLFQAIVGHARKQSAEDIANDLSKQFIMLGLGADQADLLDFVTDRGRDLSQEIKATCQALALYDMGLQTPGILVQVRSILKAQPKNEEA